MATQESDDHKAARLVSNVLHPWVVLAPVVALATQEAAGEPLEWINWDLLALLPAYVLPLLYARIRVSVVSTEQGQKKISQEVQ